MRALIFATALWNFCLVNSTSVSLILCGLNEAYLMRRIRVEGDFQKEIFSNFRQSATDSPTHNPHTSADQVTRTLHQQYASVISYLSAYLRV